MLVQEVYDLNIFIDDLNIFDAKGVVFVRADIFESIMKPIPTCELEVSIPVSWFDYRSIVDGTKIKFSIVSKKWGIADEYTFRIYNVKKLELNQHFVNVSIEGVIDFFDGYSHANEHNAYGLSSEVFRHIALAYGLESDIDFTNDSQLWVAGENNIYQFFNYMAQRGYINETSAMFWCLDRKKRLLYKNLTDLFRNRQEKIYTFVQTPTPNPSQKQFGYTSAKGSIQAGTNNLKNEGYGGVDEYFDLLTYSWKDVAARKVVAESNLINISKELAKGLGQNWYPFDVGNLHPNYYTALKQNKRIMSTYSSYMTLESQFFQPYRLAQIVNFEYYDAQDPSNKVYALSGTYVIDAIHISMSLSSITAMVEIAMQGLNGKAKTRETY
jgi:hypothetical protein